MNDTISHIKFIKKPKALKTFKRSCQWRVWKVLCAVDPSSAKFMFHHFPELTNLSKWMKKQMIFPENSREQEIASQFQQILHDWLAHIINIAILTLR